MHPPFPRNSRTILQQQTMESVEESVEDVVIVGAGIAGLATAVGLHRKGLKNLVLESSESLRATGFAITNWTNAWRALDALGVGDHLRKEHLCLERTVATSAASGVTTSILSLNGHGSNGKHEVRCVRRKQMLTILVKELPPDTIRYSSKVVSIEEAGHLKLLHLVDGTTIKTKVLIGCDGVNSVVARWLGLKKLSFSGRSSTRGFAEFPDGHGFKPDFLQYLGKGFRTGFVPCDEKSVYWFFNWTPQDKKMEQNATEMKQFVLTKLRLAKVPEKLEEVVQKSNLTELVSSPLKFRWPIELLWANISKENVCVAGDALHPMTPDLGQGGCAALEDGVVLARCLGDAFLEKDDQGKKGEYGRIKKALEKFAKERRGRSFGLIATAYVLGLIQTSDGAIMNFLRDKCLSRMMSGVYLKAANFDCGKL